MRSCVVTLSACLVAGAVLAASGDKPYPIFPAKYFVENMKLLGPNFAAADAALAKGDFEAAKARLIRSRELLAVTITYWRDRKQDDAIRILRDVLAKLDGLDTTLSAEKVDQAAALSQFKQIGPACGQCHNAYREAVPGGKGFRFKAGMP